MRWLWVFWFITATFAAEAVPQSFLEYAGKVRPGIAEGVAKLNTTAANWQGIVKVWVDSVGRVTKVRLGASTGPGIDEAALLKELSQAQLPSPPPGLPMPIVLRLTARPNPAKTPEEPVKTYLREVEKRIVQGLRQMPEMPVLVDGTVQLWMDAGGRVTKAGLVNAKGLVINETEVLKQLGKITFPTPPPGTPMPVSTHLKMEPKN
jgi:hypothetical protein